MTKKKRGHQRETRNCRAHQASVAAFFYWHAYIIMSGASQSCCTFRIFIPRSSLARNFLDGSQRPLTFTSPRAKPFETAVRQWNQNNNKTGFTGRKLLEHRWQIKNNLSKERFSAMCIYTHTSGSKVICKTQRWFFLSLDRLGASRRVRTP